MTKPLPAKAEVALEYPDKFYIGAFDRDSRFDTHLDERGLSLVLQRAGDADTRKSVHMARTVAKIPADDVVHRKSLADAARRLARSLTRPK